jgi:hypothetical protein
MLKGFKGNVLNLYEKRVEDARKASLLRLQYVPKEKPGVDYLRNGQLLLTPSQPRYFSVPKFVKQKKPNRRNYIQFYDYNGLAESNFLGT